VRKTSHQQEQFYLRALRAADEAIGAPADVRRVVLSFDPRDTVGDMESTAAHLAVAGRKEWLVGVADPVDIERLSRALGFWFAWDESRQQFDHPAMLAGIRNGRVARLLVGPAMTSARLAEVVRESRGQFVASYPLPGATRVFQQAVLDLSQDLSILTVLSDGLRRVQLHELAVQTARRAVHVDGGAAIAWYALGSALLESERPSEALESVEQALRIEPRCVDLSVFRRMGP
jgi:tetratricopeptide (TPR) repeat protein